MLSQGVRAFRSADARRRARCILSLDALPVSAARLRLFYFIAAASFAPALFFYFAGEEAIFPLSSYEMWFAGEWRQQIFYGANLQHNPLFNWLIIPIAAAAGWDFVLGVARFWTIAATIGTGAVAGWLTWKLHGDRRFGLFCALIYITLADVFFYRGWLAYADPLFGFFVWTSIACLWVACLETRRAYLVPAVLSLTLAFMTKALTAYVFYGAAGLVLLANRDYRRFLLSPPSWAIHAAAAAAPLAWFAMLPHAGQSDRMFAEIFAKLVPEGAGTYALKLVAYPLETMVRLAPAMLLAGYYGWKFRTPLRRAMTSHDRMAAAILLINYLPYWLAPHSHTRYLTPLYPLFALLIARVLWASGAASITLRWITALIAVKLVLALAVFPYYQAHYRGENFLMAARDIVGRTRGYALYADNVSASGMSVVTHIDLLRRPQPPITFPPEQWESGFLVAYEPDPARGAIAQQYRLGGNDLYLLCRGDACAKGQAK
jgi:4-amino-4-deoxy-L-arabinose transferase-like glycosyltransferase